MADALLALAHVFELSRDPLGDFQVVNRLRPARLPEARSKYSSLSILT